jgi:hypothetical protein
MRQSCLIAVSPAPTLEHRIDEVALDKELP